MASQMAVAFFSSLYSGISTTMVKGKWVVGFNEVFAVSVFGKLR